MGIDILYIKGKESENKDLELKYSLRSLERFVRDYGRIFITGECPDYIDKTKVIYTQEEDIGDPMKNHMHKVKQTIRKTDISEYFVLMYDDIFFKRETHLMNYPAYQRGKLGEQHTGNVQYRNALEKTKKWLNDRMFEYYDYELHIPFVYQRGKFLMMESMIWEKEIAVRSVYGNIFCEKAPYRTDIKIRATNEKVEDIPEKYECFSVSDKAFPYDVQEWCESHFQTKSRWEK